jgi:hypothetical protein
MPLLRAGHTAHSHTDTRHPPTLPNTLPNTLPCTQEGRARFSAAPSPADLAAFHAVSPIAHVDSVTAPMIFMLGAKDRRVSACAMGAL